VLAVLCMLTRRCSSPRPTLEGICQTSRPRVATHDKKKTGSPTAEACSHMPMSASKRCAHVSANLMAKGRRAPRRRVRFPGAGRVATL